MARPATWIKRGLRTAGIDIARAIPTAEGRRQALIEAHGIATVIDVGANAGQYGEEIRGAGFTGTIVSFEPLAEVFPRLQETTAADPRWRAVQLGLSEAAGSLPINVAGNTASSSLLPMATLHSDALPSSAIVATELITLARLDEVEEVRDLAGPLMLKIDVQGAELSVLAGATGIIDRVDLIEIELSVRELYEGQPLLPAVLDALAAYDFSLIALEPGFRDTRTGAILQFDGLFARN